MPRILFWFTGLEAAIATNHGAFSGAPGDGIVSENGRVANFLLTRQVAVGMPVTWHPRHRSARADFSHTALDSSQWRRKARKHADAGYGHEGACDSQDCQRDPGCGIGGQPGGVSVVPVPDGLPLEGQRTGDLANDSMIV